MLVDGCAQKRKTSTGIVHVHTPTCVKEIILLCTRTPDTTRAFLSAVISSDESVKVREKHSAVMA